MICACHPTEFTDEEIETFHFVDQYGREGLYNVTLAKLYARRIADQPTSLVVVEEIVRSTASDGINAAHLACVDISVPGIAATWQGGPDFVLIDGRHRVWRAAQLGHEGYPVHVLPAAVADSCIINGPLDMLRHMRELGVLA